MIVLATALAPHNRRTDFAMSTWTGDVREIECARTAADIGCTRGCYYFKDVFDEALKLAPDDVFCYLNNDVALVPEWTMLVPQARARGCAASNRIDIAKFTRPLDLSQIMGGERFPGKDLFVFTPAWWRQVRDDLPDVVLGYEGFDFVLFWKMQENGARFSLPVCYHERHEAFWRQPENIHENPVQAYNRKLCREWIIARGGAPACANGFYCPFLFGSIHEGENFHLSTAAGSRQTNLSTSAEAYS
jgi:hypothetical protein